MDLNQLKENKPKRPVMFYYAIAFVVLLLLNFVLVPWLSEKSIKETTYNEFVGQLDAGNVTKVEVRQDEYSIYYIVEVNGKELICKTGLMDDPNLVERLDRSGVEYGTPIPTKQSPFLALILTWIIPIAIFMFIGNMLSKKLAQSMGGPGAMSFGKSNAKIYVKSSTGIKFSDVAGEDEAKELLSEIVDYLHHPEQYQAIGAKMPKGALLVGPPGTGKTLLAKAVAGEAEVPFFSISGSEFVEMFVGMGAAKVRDLFKQANEKAPCIVFIDEIDTIGKKRDGNFSGNDEREQTLNQLLTEMDGFDGSKGVVILAATNRPDSLDPALLRPGRFDRRIPVELPDLQGREEILKVHAKNIKIADNVDFSAIAKAASGASGAELANIVNEAALRAVRDGRRFATQADMEESIEVVIAGYQKKNRVLSEKEKLIVAYHEIGHALVAAKQTNSAPVHKITIIPRTSGALGYTMQVEDGEHFLMSKEELENKIATFTGGRAAEELIFHSITTGASNDIEQATKIARGMITRFGMSDEFDMVAMENVTNQYLGGDSTLACSFETQTLIDKKVVELVKKQHDKALQILQDNIMKLHELAKYLYENETITGEEFMNILENRNN
ncbi:MAG: ATP-dependent zinc metalloprotease FtsH [Eubacterium sp.]|nr:ATP-dependent zinc metalloprotease FtsH [Eubacterium sp.]